MIIRMLTLGAVETNCYVVGCEETRDGVIIDPSDDAARILRTVVEERLTIRYVLNTHAHFDHILANAAVVSSTGAPLALHPLDLPLLRERGGALLFGIQAPASPEPDLLLEEGMTLAFGTHTLRVLFTPGHTRGHVCFHEPTEEVLFAGDLLFAGSVGRTDLPGGDHDTLLRSIEEKIRPLVAATRVYSGHGPATTVGEELAHNPWLQ